MCGEASTVRRHETYCSAHIGHPSNAVSPRDISLDRTLPHGCRFKFIIAFAH
ncbi:hypothetical protein Trydic_g23931, partial [Trypoxylus dichotomus]